MAPSTARRRVYLDHNATTPLRPEARAAMAAAFDLCGNASSVHAEGRAARALIEETRAELLSFVNAPSGQAAFTSGGTEALNLALTPHLRADQADRRPFDLLLLGAGEHAAVRAGHRFPAAAVESVDLTAQGTLDLDALDSALQRHEGRRMMLVLQAANNETGVVQPVSAAAERVHAAGGFVVCDAVQAMGKIDCDISRLGADALALSAHKFGGPQGVGALCFATRAPHIEEMLLRGGGQERGLRAGTENVAGIAGLGAALRAVKAERAAEATRFAAWRDQLEAEIARIAPGAYFFGAEVERLPNTSCFAVPETEAQVLLMLLDLAGVAVSSGSACSSGKVKPSHVLAAMGVKPELARCAIRVSLGWNSHPDDYAIFVRALEAAVGGIEARREKAAGGTRRAG
ncbi:cysteine desulfurase family protein [Methylocapsa acidiphila]|uniref:cysteine desulfurase family protein n=1 Tax=Methylocapsa acidiphila TaxID=133552 RepID=UPI0004284014|nr:cysteine desulfurase family protein [Methylocapsa acidiphila]